MYCDLVVISVGVVVVFDIVVCVVGDDVCWYFFCLAEDGVRCAEVSRGLGVFFYGCVCFFLFFFFLLFFVFFLLFFFVFFFVFWGGEFATAAFYCARETVSYIHLTLPSIREV